MPTNAPVLRLLDPPSPVETDNEDVCAGLEVLEEVGETFRHDVSLEASTENVLDFVMPKFGFAVSKATRLYCPGGTFAAGLQGSIVNANRKSAMQSLSLLPCECAVP